MSEPTEPNSAGGNPTSESAEETEAGRATAPASPQPSAPADTPQRGPVRRWVTGRRSRWVAGGLAAVVLIGGSSAVTAAVVNHGGGSEVAAVRVGPDGLAGLKRALAGGRIGAGAVPVKGGQVGVLPGGLAVPDGSGMTSAPAPLPTLSAAQAAGKAFAAVSGGKVESLAPLPEQGGGSAWQAVVVGPDGVHHLVTLDGSSGAITSNTVIGG